MGIRHDYSDVYPIITTTLKSTTTFADVLLCFQTVDNYLTETQNSMVYWVIDAKLIQVSYGDTIQIIEATSEGVVGSGGDARVIPLMVMDDHIYEYLLEELENRYIWMQFPNFQTVDEAISFVQYINYLQRE